MSFTYNIMTEEEALRERFQLMPDGEYDAYVERAESKISKSGNPMIELTLSVFDKNGHSKLIKDYLVASSHMQWKIIHFCNSAGLSKEYADGKFNESLAYNKNVRVRVKTQQGQIIPIDKLSGKEPGDKYPDRNIIEEYLEGAKNSPIPKAGATDYTDQDVPF